MKNIYEEQIMKAYDYINHADMILIGAGAGLSTAAGLNYTGKRFTDNFREFIDTYGSTNMRDMYSSGFYAFSTEEAKWGYWSKHSKVNRIDPPALPLYKKLYEIIKGKDYFVITTNVDHQFQKAGFSDDRIFATQGDYGLIQCEKGCHSKTYDAIELFEQMDAMREACLIPSNLVPKCPVCGGRMTMHLRCDQFFVEDEFWHMAARRYWDYCTRMEGKKVVLLELGVGFNTPAIIRYPFEKMTHENHEYFLVRCNLDEAFVPQSLENRAVGIHEDIAKCINDIYLLGK